MLKARNLGKYYDEGDYIFRHLDLDVAPGDIVTVLGPNARGKTTLLKTLAGLLEPSEGTVEREGIVGYVPQTRQTVVSYPVIEMVIMGRAAKMRAWQTPGAKERAIAHACLERVGIAHLADTPYSHLSGGQKQLVLIARAIATDPTILLLDEPTSALDLKNQMLVLEICMALADEGMGIVLTTHAPSHAGFVADTILGMFPGHSPTMGSAKEMLTSENLSLLYDTPVTVHDVDVNGKKVTLVAPTLGRTRDTNTASSRQEATPSLLHPDAENAELPASTVNRKERK
ncbi:MAG: ABC transporter ATP-binding protein [Actinomycetaceae bacterium]|nr:ABC transporter ATP-binding protein [Actinomycetaceae bacterium]